MITKNHFTRIAAVCVFASAAAISCLPASAAAGIPGTLVAKPAVNKAKAVNAVAASATALQEFYTANGHVYLSTDGAGSNDPVAYIDVEKRTAQSVVRKAFLLAATTPGAAPITDGQITLGGIAVDVDETTAVLSGIGASNVRADVTAIIKPALDAAAPGRVTFSIAELNTGSVDGEILAVVFDDPAEPTGSVSLLFGAQNPGGDSFAVRLSDPISSTNPAQKLAFALGISFGFQGGTQYSTVDVNGVRLTSAAGGQDDGYGANGALLTVGGLDDSADNPTDPYAAADACGSPPRCDDELYDLKAVLPDGTTSIDVATLNPSFDDNIFFASFVSADLAAIVNEGVVLSPSTQTRKYTEIGSLDATIQDDDGTPVVGRDVTIQVTSGPNAGISTSGPTNAEGTLTLALYCGVNETVGTDTVIASFVDSKGVPKVSNEATMICESVASKMTATASIASRTVSLTATLLTDSDVPLSGKTVQFASAKKAVCSAVTDVNGVAACSSTQPIINGTLARSYTASFVGDGVAQPSSASAALTR